MSSTEIKAIDISKVCMIGSVSAKLSMYIHATPSTSMHSVYVDKHSRASMHFNLRQCTPCTSM